MHWQSHRVLADRGKRQAAEAQQWFVAQYLICAGTNLKPQKESEHGDGTHQSNGYLGRTVHVTHVFRSTGTEDVSPLRATATGVQPVHGVDGYSQSTITATMKTMVLRDMKDHR